MGCLDPQLDKQETFELLRKRGARSVVLTFSGGHDEGGVESIEMVYDDGREEDFLIWYCGGYGFKAKDDPTFDPLDYTTGFIPLSKPANEDERLSDLLQGPIDDKFSSWDSVNSTSGTLTWEVEGERCVLEYTQDQEVWSGEKEVVFDG